MQTVHHRLLPASRVVRQECPGWRYLIVLPRSAWSCMIRTYIPLGVRMYHNIAIWLSYHIRRNNESFSCLQQVQLFRFVHSFPSFKIVSILFFAVATVHLAPRGA